MFVREKDFQKLIASLKKTANEMNGMIPEDQILSKMK